MRCHMGLRMRLQPDDLGVLVGAIVRQFVPDFVPKGFDERQVVAEGARLSKVIPKKMRAELLPFALECASDVDLRLIGASLVDAGNRAGQGCAVATGPALAPLKRLGHARHLRTLL